MFSTCYGLMLMVVMVVVMEIVLFVIVFFFFFGVDCVLINLFIIIIIYCRNYSFLLTVDRIVSIIVLCCCTCWCNGCCVTTTATHLVLSCHVVSKLEILVLQSDGEARVVRATEDERPSCLPHEAVPGTHTDGIPERPQVQVRTFSCSNIIECGVRWAMQVLYKLQFSLVK